MKFNIIYLLTALLLTTSCSDVLIADHIEGTWELKTYLRNDVDESFLVKISGYEESYILAETYSRNYVDGNQDPVEESGRFSINEDDWTIHISDVSSISEFSEAHSTLSTSILKVETIDEIELVYTFENGGDSHEFRFMKKE
jgi:hypothetical protein